MDRLFVALGSLAAFLAVALGAFAAHGLKAHLSAVQLATFELGVRYQMDHALALLAAGFAYARWPRPAAAASGCLFVIGIALFSGSLYALALADVRWIGAVTPVGGTAFLLGWLCLAWAACKR